MPWSRSTAACRTSRMSVTWTSLFVLAASFSSRRVLVDLVPALLDQLPTAVPGEVCVIHGEPDRDG